MDWLSGLALDVVEGSTRNDGYNGFCAESRHGDDRRRSESHDLVNLKIFEPSTASATRVGLKGT